MPASSPCAPAAGVRLAPANPAISASHCSSVYITASAPCDPSSSVSGCSARETGQPGGVLVDLGVVLHGAGAERVEAAVDAVVEVAEVGEVAHDLKLADFRQVEVVAQQIGRAAAFPARRTSGRVTPVRPGTLWS